VALTEIKGNGLAFSPTLGLVTIVGCSVLCGCVNSRIEQVKQGSTTLAEGEAIVILARRHDHAGETEASFTDCVESKLSGGDRPLRVHPNKAFVDAMFPWFEPSIAPLSTDSLPELLANPGVREKIEQTGVRYVVWLDGSTERVDSGGSMTCTVGPTGGGCLGFGWWEDAADYEATVWDLKNHSAAGMVSADVNGTSYLPALVVPIPLIARTQAAACSGLARQLSQFLVTSDVTSE
jgi:hypothetical protein